MQYQKDGFLQSPHQKYGPFLLYYWCSCHMVPDLILYFMATWRSPNIFSQDKKKRIFLKIVSLAKFLWRSKKYSFLFLIFSRLLAMAFSFLHAWHFENFVDDKNPMESMFRKCSNGLSMHVKLTSYVQLA